MIFIFYKSLYYKYEVEIVNINNIVYVMKFYRSEI